MWHHVLFLCLTGSNILWFHQVKSAPHIQIWNFWRGTSPPTAPPTPPHKFTAWPTLRRKMVTLDTTTPGTVGSTGKYSTRKIAYRSTSTAGDVVDRTESWLYPTTPDDGKSFELWEEIEEEKYFARFPQSKLKMYSKTSTTKANKLKETWGHGQETTVTFEHRSVSKGVDIKASPNRDIIEFASLGKVTHEPTTTTTTPRPNFIDKILNTVGIGTGNGNSGLSSLWNSIGIPSLPAFQRPMTRRPTTYHEN